jgi:hypothetical protein
MWHRFQYGWTPRLARAAARLFGVFSSIRFVGMFDALSRDERLLLLRFVCAFAWTDLEVTPRERAFVESVRGVIYADGHVDPEEREQFEKLQAALST